MADLSSCRTVVDVPECQNAIGALCLVIRIQKRHQRVSRRTPRRSKLSYLTEALNRFQSKEIEFLRVGLTRFGQRLNHNGITDCRQRNVCLLLDLRLIALEQDMETDAGLLCYGA